MGTSRYPRHGQRIAPRILREALLVPLPPPLATATAGRYQFLADLDETVWGCASLEVCQRLGETVAKHLNSKLLRLPLMVRWHVIPIPSFLTRPEDLPISTRALNCLRSLCEDDVRKLGNSDLGDLARRRGMGARSFLEILCALESVAAPDKDSQQLRLNGLVEEPRQAEATSPEELPKHLEVQVSRYPRVGQKLAPKTLAPVLNVPVRDRRMSILWLKDLDESAWDKFAPETCVKFAEAIVAQVQHSPGKLAKLGSLRVPVPRTNGEPIRIHLQQRTFNRLKELDALHNPGNLAGMTLSDLFHMPGFGVRCLVDLLTALESASPVFFQSTSEVAVAARGLVDNKASKFISQDDPRFGLELQALSGQGKNLKQIAEHILRSAKCSMAPKLYAARLERLHHRLRSATGLSLEEELEGLLCLEPNERNRGAALMHFGWQGNGPRTLEEVACELRISRERVRQICRRQLERLEGTRPYLPVLDRTLKVSEGTVPCLESVLEDVLHAKGLTKRRFLLEGLRHAAEATGRACPLLLEQAGDHMYAVPANMRGVTKLVSHIARKSISHWGVATIEDIAAQASTAAGREVPGQFASAVLSVHHGFRWLDQPSGWFWLESTARNALLNQIEKVFSACSRVHVSELRAGVSRHHRREGFAPPQRVLLQLCAQSGWCRVEGNFVSAVRPLDHQLVLNTTEAAIVDVLKENGGILTRQQLEDLCIARGIKRDVFYVHLTYSPVIARYAPSVYGIRGLNIAPGYAESLVTERRPRRVLQDFRWTSDRRIQLIYKLSKGGLSNGIVSIPAAMRSYIQGPFSLQAGDGERIGQLVVKGTQAWGLLPLFRRRGGEPGDPLTICFDLQAKTVTVEIGQASSELDELGSAVLAT
jgi:hypothetical protein